MHDNEFRFEILPRGTVSLFVEEDTGSVVPQWNITENNSPVPTTIKPKICKWKYTTTAIYDEWNLHSALSHSNVLYNQIFFDHVGGIGR